MPVECSIELWLSDMPLNDQYWLAVAGDLNRFASYLDRAAQAIDTGSESPV